MITSISKNNQIFFLFFTDIKSLDLFHLTSKKFQLIKFCYASFIRIAVSNNNF